MEQIVHYLNPTVARAFSKSLADLFYETEPSGTSEQRIGRIESLQKICARDESHVSRESVCEILIKKLKALDCQDEIVNLGFKSRNVLDEIDCWHEMKKEKRRFRDNKREIFNSWRPDVIIEGLQSPNIDWSIPTEATGGRESDSDVERKERALLCFAVYNISTNIAFVKDYMDNCVAKFDELMDIERDLIYYLWHNCSDTSLLLSLFNNFSFLYEKPLLRLCCHLLKSECNADILKVCRRDRDIGVLMELFRTESYVHDVIYSMLYDLYVSCDLNAKFLIVMDVLRAL